MSKIDITVYCECGEELETEINYSKQWGVFITVEKCKTCNKEASDG